MRRRAAAGCALALALAAPPAGAQEAGPGAAPDAAPDVACVVPAQTAAPGTPANLRELRRFATGAGVRVAVIDTGVAPHPELARLTPGAHFVGADSLTDCDGHGTVVAGIIAGRTLGIAPGAEIISVRQTSSHYRGADAGNLETLAGAINAALDTGARVLNLSVVSCVDPRIAPRIDASGLTTALRRAEAEGAVVVAAAGNAGPDCAPDSAVFPAQFPTVLAVAARDGDHALAPYSLPADLSAPGAVPAALSPSGAGWSSGTLTAQGGVAPYAGTSFAAPVVSGSVALLMSRYPGISPAHVRALVAAAAAPGGGAVDPLAVLTQLAPDPVAAGATLTVTPADEVVSRAPARLGAAAAALAAAALACTVAAASTSRSARPRG